MRIIFFYPSNLLKKLFLFIFLLSKFSSILSQEVFEVKDYDKKMNELEIMIAKERYIQAYDQIKELLDEFKKITIYNDNLYYKLEMLYFKASNVSWKLHDKAAQYFYDYKKYVTSKIKNYNSLNQSIKEINSFESSGLMSKKDTKDLRKEFEKLKKDIDASDQQLYSSIIEHYKGDTTFSIDKVDTTLFVYNSTENNINVSSEKIIELNVSGRGLDKNTAILNALKSAIDQTSNTFITTNTSIINDSLAKDEITSVSSGTIRSQNIVTCDTISKNDVVVLLHVKISVNSLSNYIKSKGGESEFDGESFVYNQKLRLLNEQNEIKSLESILGNATLLFRNSLDATIKTYEPTATSGNNWEIPVILNISFNKNLNNFISYLYNQLKNLSVNSKEYQSYFTVGLENKLKIIAVGPTPLMYFDSSSLKSKSFELFECPYNTLFFYKNKKLIYQYPQSGFYDKSCISFDELNEEKKKYVIKELLEYCENLSKLKPDLDSIVYFNRLSGYYDQKYSKTGHSPFIYLRTNESVELVNNFLKQLYQILFSFKISNGIEEVDLNSKSAELFKNNNEVRGKIEYFEFYPALDRDLNEFNTLPTNYVFDNTLKTKDFISNSPFNVPLSNQTFNYIYDTNGFLGKVEDININSLISMFINLNAFKESQKGLLKIRYNDNYTLDQIQKISKYKIEFIK